ncbi:GIY-YIG nuclease family protein [Chloroflexota bacterium]
MRQRNRNICGYWDCNERIPGEDFLCADHYQMWVDGIIDRCPKCTRFKDVKFELCLDCYFGRPVKPWEPSVEIPPPKQDHKVEYSSFWEDGYMSPDKVFIYILELDDGVLYVGRNTDLRKGLSEHRKSKSSSTAEGNPKLRYAQVVATQATAELREAELKRMIESNPEQIHLMIADFQSDMREFGFEDF